MAYANSGGFIPTSLPSPAPSTASTRAAAGLPHPRSKPLLPGSRKEDYAREYVSQRLLHVSRRYVKKHGVPNPGDTVTGYESFDQVCKDLEEIVDVLWFSGTPSLQVPYLLNVALVITEYLPSFLPSPRPTFALLKKLDHCFASLLSGQDIRSHEPLPGFERGMGHGMTRTDMVRCKSLADETRLQIATKMSNEADVENHPSEDDNYVPPVRLRRKRKADPEDGDDEGARIEKLSVKSPKKRKTTSPVRIKTESPGINVKHEGSVRSPAALDQPTHTGNVTGAASNDGQFHFAVDEDSDEAEANQDEFPNHASGLRRRHGTPPQTISDPNQEGYSDDDTGTERLGEDDEGLEGDEGEEDEEDEEEELHMNVAKVYDKTIMQLGKVLGESIVG
ncbi:hypothetical protein BJ170DRAFT_646048, partial [Xylariales sp. AK1849]